MSNFINSLPFFIARSGRSLDDFMDSSISEVECGLYCVCSDLNIGVYQWMRLRRSGVMEIHFNNGKRYRKTERGGAYECVHSPSTSQSDSLDAEADSLIFSFW